MDIREVLNYQLETLGELDELLDMEKEVLLKDMAEEVSGIVERKKLIAQKLSLLEKKRISLSDGQGAEALLTKGVIDKRQVDRLLELVEKIKNKEETNYILTKQSINYIRMMTSALNPSQRVVTYGSSGRAQDNSAQGIFTTKA